MIPLGEGHLDLVAESVTTSCSSVYAIASRVDIVERQHKFAKGTTTWKTWNSPAQPTADGNYFDYRTCHWIRRNIPCPDAQNIRLKYVNNPLRRNFFSRRSRTRGLLVILSLVMQLLTDGLGSPTPPNLVARLDAPCAASSDAAGILSFRDFSRDRV